MPVNSTHPDYDENLEAWQRIRDVLAGDRAIKRAGEKYVARLDSQNDDEFRAYIERGFFYNATSRTVSGYVGMIFRRDPVLQLPEKSVALHPALKGFVNDVDLLGTTLDSYAKNIIEDVVALGRAGTLIDWDGEKENRAYVSMYAAESILNWRQTRINGLLKLSLVVLAESATDESQAADPFVVEMVQQIRVLKLVPNSARPHPSPLPRRGRSPRPPVVTHIKWRSGSSGRAGRERRRRNGSSSARPHRCVWANLSPPFRSSFTVRRTRVRRWRSRQSRTSCLRTCITTG